MGSEIQLISGGEGLAVLGNPAEVERLLAAEGLSSRDLAVPGIGGFLNVGAMAASTGSAVAAGSGRWVQLTKESAQAVNKFDEVLRSQTNQGLADGQNLEEGETAQVMTDPKTEHTRTLGILQCQPLAGR